ncbi:MAG: class I SAM-dependent methyltransferase [Chloroflexota bacterium]|nr:class I SAM-dependent methyltransferase [Chloroflexota bacterium]
MKISQALVAQQYQTPVNLNARIQLHARFSASPYSWFRWLFDHFALSLESRILELGCGPGLLWRENRDRLQPGWEFTLTDFSPGMVAEARRNLVAVLPSTADFRLVDAQEIPFGANTFDLVIANHMLYHVPERQRALAECRRVLKPGGRFYTSTIGERHMLELWEMVERFRPGVVAQLKSNVLGFTLENGAAQLAAYFGAVEQYLYDDGLLVTEVAPLVDYVLSSNTLTGHPLTPAQERDFGALVARRLAEERGSLRITKASGLFVATG